MVRPKTKTGDKLSPTQLRTNTNVSQSDGLLPLPAWMQNLFGVATRVRKWLVALSLILFVIWLLSSYGSTKNSTHESTVSQQMPILIECAPAEEAWRSGEMRFRKNKGVMCYEITLSSYWTLWIYLPRGTTLSWVSPGGTAADFELQLADQEASGQSYPVRFAKEDRVDSDKWRMNFGTRCPIFRVKDRENGQNPGGKVRVMVNNFERLEPQPHGVVRSTDCPRIY